MLLKCVYDKKKENIMKPMRYGFTWGEGGKRIKKV
jgi:hypothetical protein